MKLALLLLGAAVVPGLLFFLPTRLDCCGPVPVHSRKFYYHWAADACLGV